MYIFLEGGKGGRREKHELVASHMPPTGDQEWNQQTFRLQACAQSTEPHQPGLCLLLHPATALVWCSPSLSLQGSLQAVDSPLGSNVKKAQAS